jgi:hypothetical protein
MKTRRTKREEAATRQEYWSSLSAAEQLSALDARLGFQVGAVKQRARLVGSPLSKAELFGILYGAGPKTLERIREQGDALHTDAGTD